VSENDGVWSKLDDVARRHSGKFLDHVRENGVGGGACDKRNRLHRGRMATLGEAYSGPEFRWRVRRRNRGRPRTEWGEKEGTDERRRPCRQVGADEKHDDGRSYVCSELLGHSSLSSFTYNVSPFGTTIKFLRFVRPARCAISSLPAAVASHFLPGIV
jgi:hypothetical protein